MEAGEREAGETAAGETVVGQMAVGQTVAAGSGGGTQRTPGSVSMGSAPSTRTGQRGAMEDGQWGDAVTRRRRSSRVSGSSRRQLATIAQDDSSRRPPLVGEDPEGVDAARRQRRLRDSDPVLPEQPRRQVGHGQSYGS